MYGHAKDDSGTFGVETQLPLTSNLVPFTSNAGAGITDQDVSFKDLNAMSSAGTSTGVTQNEHVVGKFISSAKAGTKTTSRISNYGNQYDLIMSAAKGSQPTGVLGYYINPSMINGAIGALQGAVNAAKPGDIINAAAGQYKEDVNINKAITLKGSGDPTANSFTLNSILGTESGGITAPLINVMSGAKIQNGITLASTGGTVNVGAGTYTDDLDQRFYDKNIVLYAASGVGVNSIILDRPLGGIGQDFANIATNTVNVKDNGKIQQGVDLVSSSGTVDVAAGDYGEAVNINKPLTLKGDGTGPTTATSFELTNGATLGGSSGGITAPLAIVNPYSKIADGLLLSSQDVHVYGDGGSYIYGDQLDQSALGSNIILTGFNNALIDSISINQPVAGKISGIKANTVNILNNGAKIKDGISLASTGGTVNVGSGTFYENINIDKSLTIKGNGIANTIVNGNGAGSVFSIDGSATAAISNLKITNGRAFNGAGISNAGFLTLSNIELFGNTATQEGGGIYNSNTGTVALQDATISGNTAPSGPDIASYGNVVLNSAFSTLPGSYSTTVTVNNGAKIRDGVNLAAVGGTVNVGAGTYYENVQIDKSSLSRNPP